MNTFILLPLYIWPLPAQNNWGPLYDAAFAHPEVNFKVVINPGSGPGDGTCPGPDYETSLAQLATYPNVQTLGYVHTANRWDCGPTDDWICTCSAPITDVQANVTKYANWATSGNCGDIAVDGIFMDESPSGPECIDYMDELTTFTKAALPADSNRTVLFNAGVAVDPAYWAIADYINVLENSAEFYESEDIGALDCQGACARQTTMILYEHGGRDGTLARDVDTILNLQHDAIAGLHITDSPAGSAYTQFGSDWMDFVAEVKRVTLLNREREG